MLISTITLVVMRLFSLLWFVQSLGMFATAGVSLEGPELYQHRGSWFIFAMFVPALAMLSFSIIAWIIAPFLARFIAGKYDAPVVISGLSLQDLYSFGFAFLGLYFVLNSLGDTLNWLHYSLVIAASHGDLDPKRKDSLYGISRPLITMIAGFVCLFSGRNWAKKLFDAGNKS